MTSVARRDGFTLVELLVAAAIGAIVLAIGAQFFAAQSRSAAFQKALNEATDNTRIALSLLSWDIQNAGYRVTVSTGERLGIKATNSGSADQLVIRFLDQASGAPQRVAYGLGGTPTALRRVQYPEGSPLAWTNSETVASIVALNVRYFTRLNKYVDLDSTGGCGADSPVTDETGKVINCRVEWTASDSADRLVQRANVELLARSETKIPGYRDPVGTYRFADGSRYVTEPGYVYHYAEQSVLTPNLGR